MVSFVPFSRAPRASSSGVAFHHVRNDRSGRTNRKTNPPCPHPLTGVSRIALVASILGRCGSWANAPILDPPRHIALVPQVIRPAGQQALAVTAVSWMRDRLLP